MSSVSPVLNSFRSIVRLPFLNAPTPIEGCDRLRAAIDSAPRLFIKRDDSTNFLVGGNKIRKLEYTMAAALAEKATAVVTVGSFQSNHARITAMVARRLGLKCHLVLNGDAPPVASGNYLVLKMLGTEIHPVATRADRMPKMKQVARDLEAKGERVFEIPLGASDETGSFGLVSALEEVLRDERAMGLRFDAIFVGSSSGGTQAGLEAGKRLFERPELRIIGVSPDDPAASIRSMVAAIARGMLQRLDAPDGLREEDVEVNDGYVGQGYGIPTPESEAAMSAFARTEGILLDPVYTSKVGAALLDHCSRGVFRPDENVLFWHTGGLIGLFH